MKITIQRQAFLKKLADVQRIIPSRTTIPILTGIKLSATTSELTLTGSDSEVSIEVTIPTTNIEAQLIIHETGSIVLPARFFSEIVKKLPSDQFTLEIDEKNQASIKSGKASFTLNGIQASDYPHLPKLNVQHSITLSVPIFRQVIQQTSIAISSIESRPILTGIFIQIKDRLLKAVATDSHRLSQRIITLPETVDKDYVATVIIPGKILIELTKIIESLETIELFISDNQVLFQSEGLSFYSRLLEGKYPDTDRLISSDYNTNLVLEANEFLSAIERASLLSHIGNNNIVKLSIQKNAVLLTGHSPEVGTVEETIDFVSVDGNSLEISFNPDYMKDSLRPFGSSEVMIKFISPVRPFTLTPRDVLSQIKDDFIQLITPVRTF